MSVLTVLLVPDGILMAADRNVTIHRYHDGGRGVTVERVGQAQYPKVFEWPNQRALIGYFGLGEVGETPMHAWLYRFLGRHLEPNTLQEVAEALVGELNVEIPTDLKHEEPLIVHLAGFDELDGERAPVVWFIRNTGLLTTEGYYTATGTFVCSEELRNPQPNDSRFVGMSAADIRSGLRLLEERLEGYWFKQGSDLATFNALESVARDAMHAIIAGHPRRHHETPTTLGGWRQHLQFSTLIYGAYYEAFHPPYDQLVGGGADVVAVPWPT